MTETHPSESIIPDILPPLDRPITLIGMMGSGKSTLGAALARLMGRRFFDSDKVIEAENGKTIPEIFEEFGDASFRQMEQQTLRNLFEAHPDAVIATGGGSITIPETASMIFGQSLCLWIHAPVELLVDRTSRQKNRPLLKSGDPHAILSGLLEKRGPIYERAPIHVETNEGPVKKIAEQALRQIREYLLEQSP